MTRFKHIILALAAAFVFCSPAGAAEENDAVPGYDENTEVTLSGIITDVGIYRRGPVVLTVKADAKTYQVVTAPRWYIAQEGISFTTGEKIEITGSKYYTKDGSLSLIANTITIAGRMTTISFRDGACNPLWMKHRHGGGRFSR
ncbi:MAG: OB-fold nucleic acid binding domain protein [Nitrospirae bacterium]|nr:MAG: OB-fold nucleic acid binding domain protein [Nitrospirota bacterium]